MSYNFDTLYQEFVTRKAKRQPDKQFTVADFISYTMADVCLHLDHQMPLPDKLVFLFDYIQENYPPLGDQ